MIYFVMKFKHWWTLYKLLVNYHVDVTNILSPLRYSVFNFTVYITTSINCLKSEQKTEMYCTASSVTVLQYNKYYRIANLRNK